MNKVITQLIQKEADRQQNNLELIASENIVSNDVLIAQGSILTNKYAEGSPNKRYYGGCEYVDEIETYAQETLKKLFNVKYANVQPHSGSQANMAVFFSLLNTGDTILGMDLQCGGHLSHGAKVSFSGKMFNAKAYYVDKYTGYINYDEVNTIAQKEKPKLIIAGGSSYSRKINFKKMKEIADSIGAYLMVDMAHFAGLVAANIIDSPVPYADIITSTTHKTLRGPRGGIIISNNKDIMDKINKSVFPGIQGGPLMHVIAAKAVAFNEALQEEYIQYAHNVVENAKAMSDVFIEHNIPVISNGTDTHLFVIDIFSTLNLKGNEVENILDTLHITTNKNSIPFDTLSPNISSGIRIGTPAITSRGINKQEAIQIAEHIVDILKDLNKNNNVLSSNQKKKTETFVKNLCNNHPLK